MLVVEWDKWEKEITEDIDDQWQAGEDINTLPAVRIILLKTTQGAEEAAPAHSEKPWLLWP